MLVSEVAGRALHQHGVEVVFGLMGSGNLAVPTRKRIEPFSETISPCRMSIGGEPMKRATYVVAGRA